MKRMQRSVCSNRRPAGILFSLVLAMQGIQHNASADPKFWKDSPEQAQVLAATFIGGKGNEWLVGGGFQPDGTIVLVGNVAGPTLELSVPVQVLGTDLPAPGEAKPVPEMEHAKGGDHQKVDKQNQPVWEKPSWRHEGVTGFVLRCSPDLKKILSAHRLPWTAGAITSTTVAADGSIYISGRAGAEVSHLGGVVEELSNTPPADKVEARCQHAFVARLSADASSVQWVRHASGPCDAPQVAIQGNGRISFAAQQIWALDPTGKLLNAVMVPGGAKKTTSLSPIDGSIIVAGEHHWPTGREPWRCPTFNVENPDGSLKYQLYDWGGPFVGLDGFRLVSDSAVRFVTHDRQGNILLYAWSDGGNSVINFQPQDIRAGIPLRGLGINAAGAGVLSAASLVRLEPKDYHATAYTMWLSFTDKGKPNSIWIDNMAVADDGTVLISGRAAYQLAQTQNKISDAPGTGQYIAVLSKKLDDVRFCSVVPGTGATEVSYERAGWGISTGVVSGHRRALFVGGATKDDGESPQSNATPTRNAMQTEFGGGWSDGYVVLLDLGEDKGSSIVASQSPPEPNPAAPKIASFDAAAPGRNKKAPPPPADGTTFVFKNDVPKWVTVEAEFRDEDGKMWPNFLYGKPVDGTARYKTGDLEGHCTVACTEVSQPKGDQSRRVLGELFQDGKPPQLQFTLESLGKIQTTELAGKDGKGHPQTRTVDFCQAKGTLDIAGKKIAITPRVTFGFGKSQGIWRGSGKVNQPTDALHLDVWATLKVSELGIKKLSPESQIDVRISMSGIALPAGATSDKK